MTNAETQNPQKIASRLAEMTLQEALAMAQDFEATAARFYRELAHRVGADAGSVAHELAAEEEQHGLMLHRLAADPALTALLSQRITAPVSTPVFQSFVLPPVLPDAPDEDELLAYAKSREESAREHYGYLAELASTGPLQDLLLFLGREEQRHVDQLDQRWSELFSVY
ncbi:MAG TPA: hypothetical protein VES73_02490 [Lamprocystis sp. (in: g-proteobacteria)]|nr:hypothetical protein [Lamprocystis sp. (in: g-proteobacteria)]